LVVKKRSVRRKFRVLGSGMDFGDDIKLRVAFATLKGVATVTKSFLRNVERRCYGN